MSKMFLAHVLWLILVVVHVKGHPGTQKDQKNLPAEWRAKMERFFAILDADNNGIVNRHEYVDIPVERAKVYFRADKINDFNDTLSQGWSTFWSVPEDEYESDFDVDDFISIHVRIDVYKSDFAAKSLTYLGKGLFRVTDYDDNGELSNQEHKDYLAVYNVQEGINSSFGFIDKNQNGFIEKEEFTKAFANYFLKRNEDSLFYGA